MYSFKQQHMKDNLFSYCIPSQKFNSLPLKIMWFQDYFPIGKVTFRGRTVKRGGFLVDLSTQLFVAPFFPTGEALSCRCSQVGFLQSKRIRGQETHSLGGLSWWRIAVG